MKSFFNHSFISIQNLFYSTNTGLSKEGNGGKILLFNQGEKFL